MKAVYPILRASSVVVVAVFSDSGVSAWADFRARLGELNVVLCTDNIHDVKNLINNIRTSAAKIEGLMIFSVPR